MSEIFAIQIIKFVTVHKNFTSKIKTKEGGTPGPGRLDVTPCHTSDGHPLLKTILYLVH